MSIHPLAALFGGDKEPDAPHPLSIEAQSENLKAAWEHYRCPKKFILGDLVRCREGMTIFTNEPVVLLFVRLLDNDNPTDLANIADTVARAKWAKLDCIVARVSDTGTVYFMLFDLDILEVLPRAP